MPLSTVFQRVFARVHVSSELTPSNATGNAQHRRASGATPLVARFQFVQARKARKAREARAQRAQRAQRALARAERARKRANLTVI